MNENKEKSIGQEKSLAKTLPFSEQELLKNLDSYTAHADELALIFEQKMEDE